MGRRWRSGLVTSSPTLEETTEADPEHWVEEHGDYLFRYAWSRLRNETHWFGADSESPPSRKEMKALRSLLSVLVLGFRLFLPTCRQASRLQSDSMEHRLSLPPQALQGLVALATLGTSEDPRTKQYPLARTLQNDILSPTAC